MKTFLITNTIFILCLLPGVSWAQFFTIAGYIHDSNGKALENVNIFEANSGIGTITNQNGFYRLILHNKKADLKITYDGFNEFSKVLEIGTDTTLTVKLMPSLNDRKNTKKELELRADNTPVKKRNGHQHPDFK